MMKSPKSSSDIISNLPDPIRIHILSFLPTVNAVASCVLSTQWKILWTNLPTLTFNDCNAPFRAHRPPHPQDMSHNIKFANFVNRVLHFHAQKPLLNFHFMCFQNAKPYDISTWISVAIMRGVRELNLWIFTGEPLPLPGCCFRSVTLEVLRIVGSIKIKPTLVYLPNLRTMELIRVEYEDAQSLNMLLASCALLDYLVIDWGSAEDVDTFIVSSSTLRYLRYEADIELEHTSFRQEGSVVNPSNDAHMSRRYLRCMTLEELHLYKVFITGTFYLPNLRVLSLNCVKFENDESASSFVSSFSSLESLVVLDPDDMSMLKISSSTLRDLRIEFPNDIVDPGLGLVLDTPALQNLSLGSWLLKDVHIYDLSSLINALICLDFRQNAHDRSYDNEMCILFQGLQSVKILSLSWMCLEGTIPKHIFPKFPELTELRVEVQYSPWPLLQQFIKNSNALQDLTLVVNKDFFEETDYGHAISWKDPEIVPECLLSSFRRLHFYGFVGSEDELAMVKYLLKSTRFMQRMVIGIVPSLDDNVKINLLQNLLKFPRRSDECEITVCSDNSMSWEKVVERSGVR